MGWHATITADKSRTEGTEIMPTTTPDPPQAGGAKAVPEADMQNPTRNAGIVAKRATEKASAGRSALIRINPDRARPVGRTGKAHSMRKDRKDPKLGRPVRGQPS